MGQSAHPGRARRRWGSAWVALGSVLATVTVAGCAHSVAAATTTLRAPSQVSVVHANGSTVPGLAGLRLRPGDVVRTGPAGRAELVTRSRVVYVGSNAAVQVVDGGRQQLRQGAVVVDAQHGPGLDLRLAALDVTVPAGAATRAERSVTVRVGSLAGPATRVVSDTGRRLAVPALYQAVVGGDALPDAPTPLRLTDDDGEAHAVPALVRDDETLLDLAAGIDGAGRSTARVVTTAWTGPTAPLPSGLARSERVLPILLAVAGGRAAQAARYRRAVTLRAEGGSWGVVARLLGVRVEAALEALAGFERGQPQGVVGAVPASLAALDRSLGAGTSPGGGSGPGGRRTSPPPGGGPAPGGAAGGSPSPSPSPSGVVATASSTVSQVLSVVPSLTPTPTSTTSAPSGPLAPLGGVTSGLLQPSAP